MIEDLRKGSATSTNITLCDPNHQHIKTYITILPLGIMNVCAKLSTILSLVVEIFQTGLKWYYDG